MPARVLIVDDEATARDRLRQLLAAFPGLEVVGEAVDGVDAVARIEALKPDLIFLDVQMPGLDGFDVLRALGPAGKAPLVIFATAFDAYALEAFEADAVGYLLKPVNREKLARAVERAERLLGDAGAAAADRRRTASLASKGHGRLTHVIGRLRDRFLPIPLEDVCFLRVEDGLVRVATSTANVRTDYALAELDARLPDPPFFRAHRQAIVNLSQVAEVATRAGAVVLVMRDGARSEVQVSERRAAAVRAILRG